jgi:hypothetical protein
MRSIFVRVEPTVRLAQGSAEVELLTVSPLLREARLGQVAAVNGIFLDAPFLK